MRRSTADSRRGKALTRAVPEPWDWQPRRHEVNELVGVKLSIGPARLVLKVSGGEVTT